MKDGKLNAHAFTCLFAMNNGPRMSVTVTKDVSASVIDFADHSESGGVRIHFSQDGWVSAT
jgi:hypothetical protein